MESTRFPLGTTRGNLIEFTELLKSRIAFRWPPLTAYSSSKILKTIVSDSLSTVSRDDGYFVRYDSHFEIPVESCIFCEKDMRYLRETMCPITTRFGKFDETSFQSMIETEKYVKESSILVDDDFRSEFVASVLEKTIHLLKTPGFFNFRYSNDDNGLRIASVLESANSPSTAVDYVASRIANLYLEKYYVRPIERFYSGLFFLSFKKLVGSKDERETLEDDEFLIRASETIRSRETRDGDDYNEGLFLFGNHQNDKLNELTKNLDALTTFKRNLVDCPDEFVSSRSKAKIRSILNFGVTLSRLLENKSLLPHLRGCNLALITHPFATRFRDYSGGVYPQRRQLAPESDKLSTGLEDHVLKMQLLTWHVRKYEKPFAEARSSSSAAEIVIDLDEYLKSLNDFLKSSRFFERIGAVTLNSRFFKITKKFLGLSSKGKKCLSLDLSHFKFVSKINRQKKDVK